MKKMSRLGGVYFLGVDTTCFMSLFIPARKDEHKKPRVRLRSGPILTTNKPRTDRGVNDLPDMGKNYKKFMSPGEELQKWDWVGLNRHPALSPDPTIHPPS